MSRGAVGGARHRPDSNAPRRLEGVSDALLQTISASGVNPSSLPHVTAIFNFPAVIIIALVTALLVIGIRESANVNNVIVLIKVAVVLCSSYSPPTRSTRPTGTVHSPADRQGRRPRGR